MSYLYVRKILTRGATRSQSCSVFYLVGSRAGRRSLGTIVLSQERTEQNITERNDHSIKGTNGTDRFQKEGTFSALVGSDSVINIG